MSLVNTPTSSFIILFSKIPDRFIVAVLFNILEFLNIDDELIIIFLLKSFIKFVLTTNQGS